LFTGQNNVFFLPVISLFLSSKLLAAIKKNGGKYNDAGVLILSLKLLQSDKPYWPDNSKYFTKNIIMKNYLLRFVIAAFFR
jgi:hypothetical protein